MATANNKSETTVDADLNKQIEELRSDIASITDLLSKRGSDDVINLQERARGVAKTAVAKAQEKVSELSEDAGRAEARMMLEIRKKPLAAVGLAAGVGFLAALMVRK
nr:hypothetical protein [uncultured Cohaesibacter sp.]